MSCYTCVCKSAYANQPCAVFFFRKQSSTPIQPDQQQSQTNTNKKKVKHQPQQPPNDRSEPEKQPSVFAAASSVEPETPKASHQTTEAKREKHRTKKQAQRTTKRAEAAAAASSAVASPPVVVKVAADIIAPAPALSPPSEGASSAPVATSSMLASGDLVSSTGYQPSASFDAELGYWESFDTSPDAAPLGGNASEWLDVQPGGSSKGHRNTSLSDTPINSASDWKTTNPSGSGVSGKRKVAISVSKHDIGKIIGQGGAVVSALRNMTGITIDIEGVKGDDANERKVYLKGPGDMVEKTQRIIRDLLNGDLSGSDVIARAKMIKVTPTAYTSSSSSGSFSHNVTVVSSATVVAPSPRAGSTTSRKVDGSTPPSLIVQTPAKSQPLPTPQPLMSKLTTTPAGLKSSSTTAAGIASKVSSTSGASTAAVSWGASKSSAQKVNFAAVAAAGVVPTSPQSKDPATKKPKPGAQAMGNPVSLLSVTFASLIGSNPDTGAPIFSSPPMTRVLDEKSFPPLSTASTSFAPSTTVSAKDASGRLLEPAPRKTSLPTPQFEEGPLPLQHMNSMKAAPSLENPRQPQHLTQSITDPVSSSSAGAAFAQMLSSAQRSVAPPSSSSSSRPQMAPIGSSRPFARAPGSERSAQRTALGAGPPLAVTNSSANTTTTSLDPISKYNISNFGSESELFATPKVPPSLSSMAPTAPQSTLNHPGPGMLSFESLLAAAAAANASSQFHQSVSQQQHRPQQQPLPPNITNNNNNQFSSNAVWSDFGGSGSEAFSSSAFDFSNTPNQQQPTANNSMANYAQLLNSLNTSARGFDMDDQQQQQQLPSTLFPPHLQSSYRLSQQSSSQGMPKFNGSGSSGQHDLSAYANAGNQRNAVFQQQRGDFSLFNGISSGGASAATVSPNPASAFHNSRLSQMFPSLVQQQPKPQPQQQQHPQPPQQQQPPSPFINLQTTQPPYGLRMPSHQPATSEQGNCYLGGGGNQAYPGKLLSVGHPLLRFLCPARLVGGGGLIFGS